MRLTPNDLREVLRRHATDIAPDGSLDPMSGLDDRVRRVRRRRTTSMSLTAVAVLLIVALVPTVARYRERTAVQAARTAPPGAASTTPSAAGAPDSAAARAPDGPPPAAPAVPVYYLTGGRLAREFRQLGEVPDRVAAAVDAAIGTPPLDPDYTSGWPASATAKVTTGEGGYAVDVSAAPPAGCSAVQQLVYTVTAAAGESTPVVVTIAGRPLGAVRGLGRCGATSKGAVSRAPQRDVLAAVQVSSPNESDRVPLRFTLAGHSRVVTGSLRWAVSDAATGAELATDAPPGLGDSADGWQFAVVLPWSAAGQTVDIEVTGKLPGGGTAADTKRVRVAD